MVKLSIIVPVYNTASYLEKCLDSLVNQTLKDIEIIVVNDGSTDNSQAIIDKYLEKYPQKIKSFIKPNGGLSDARNFGIKNASGDYLGFVDSDDYVELSMFDEMYHLAISKKADLVECDFSWDYPKKSKKDIGSRYLNTKDYFMYGRVMACNKIYKTSIIKTNSILFPFGLLYEDVEFFYKMVPYLNNSVYLNKVLYHYLQREDSIIGASGKNTDNIFTILNNIVLYYKNHNLYDSYEPYIEYLYIRLLLGSSFLRILKIKNKTLRNLMLKKTYQELNDIYPNWKKNDLLNRYRTKKNLYYKSINKFTYKLYSFILRR